MKSAFIDTNIFIYAFGKEHPLKAPCNTILRRVASEDLFAVTSVEVLQELLYVFWRKGLMGKGSIIYDEAAELVQTVLSIDKETMDMAHRLLLKYPALPPRDAVHAATVITNDVSSIVTTDTHFKQVREINLKLIAQ